MAAFEACRPDLVVLDLMLPDINGEEVCRTIRRNSSVPIIMLTAKIDEVSLLQGFHIGADDYLTKPFNPRELVARVQVLLKRAAAPASASASAPKNPVLLSPDGELRLDAAACLFTKRNLVINLTATEFRLLETFLGHPERVFSREALARIALGDEFLGSDRTIDAHIKNLRHKLEDDPHQPQWIQTVHGFGYRLASS